MDNLFHISIKKFLLSDESRRKFVALLIAAATPLTLAKAGEENRDREAFFENRKHMKARKTREHNLVNN